MPAVVLNRENLKQQIADLAVQGVFIGTSSWRYHDNAA
jgi:hypothetical protein